MKTATFCFACCATFLAYAFAALAQEDDLFERKTPAKGTTNVPGDRRAVAPHLYLLWVA